MGIIRTGKIQSHGNFNELDDRITVLEDKYVRFLWFAEISSGTSGTITPPTGGTIVLDQWAAGIDAVTSTLTTTRNPTFESAKTSAGVIITATMASNGAWTISGTPSAYPIAVLYVYDVKLISADRTKCLVELETNQGLKITDSPTFAAVNATTFDTNVAAAGVTLAGTTLAADGTDANIDINITPKGTGEVNITKVDIDGGTITGITDLVVADGGTGASTLTDGGLLVGAGADAIEALAVGLTTQILVGGGAATNPAWGADLPTAVTSGTKYIYRADGTDVPVADGGTGASTLTDHGVLVGSGTGAVTPLTVGTNGQVLVGSTGADPVFATITDGEGIDTTLGAGTISIAAETASETNPGVIEIATDVETIAGSDTARAITASNLKAKLGTQTDGGLLVGAGQTAAVEALAAGATTDVLVGGGAGVNPVWTTALPNGTTATTQASGSNDTKIATDAYADAKVADAINDGTTTIAPSQNAVFDALALKAPLAGGSLSSTTVNYNAAGATYGTGATTIFAITGGSAHYIAIMSDYSSTANYAVAIVMVSGDGASMAVANVLKAGAFATSGWTASTLNLQINNDAGNFDGRASLLRIR